MAAAIRSSEVFPAPLGPITTQRSSSSTCQLMGPTSTLPLDEARHLADRSAGRDRP